MFVDLTSARPAEKTGSRGALAAVGRPIAWPDVLAVLQTARARSEATMAVRAAGFSPDDFGHRRAAREAVADALTCVEDTLELAGPRARAERERIRDLRRRLELEVWP